MACDITEYLRSLKDSAKFGPQVVCHREIPPKEAEYAANFPPLAGSLLSCLRNQGISRLYRHQAEAIDRILRGENVLIATPTASGKSMIYNLPVMNELFASKPACALYLFPLKALAQDQLQTLLTFHDSLPGEERWTATGYAAVFDGDTSPYQRRKIRHSPPPVIMTNAEMVHLSFLPFHGSWAAFFARLKYVVIDEVHSYRGVLGTHMAWILRRLKRIASHYGAKIQFILLSATIGNPHELGHRLIGEEISVIDRSGAPQAERNMLFLNPWDSAAYTASQLIEAAIKRELRTIVYTQSRKMTELINLWTRPRLGGLGHKLSAYRAGFLPEERREIERQLFAGDLLGVISTSALELGIDIGDLDLCILVGYPGSIMATWQRGGRVGRGQRTSATILIAQEDALDQHFMRQPDDFFTRQPESAVLNPENETIMGQHLVCACSELPMTGDDLLLQQEAVKGAVLDLTARGALLETVSGGQWISSRKYPQRQMSLRGGGSPMAIIEKDSGEVVGEIDVVRGMKECHPGAVYLHRAETYVVEKFDIIANEILTTRNTPKYFTRPMTEKHTVILEVLGHQQLFDIEVFWGKLQVREKVTGYQKRNSQTQKLIATEPLDLPEQIMETEGVWITLPAPMVAAMEREKYHFMGAIHALEHGMIAMFPLLVLCDRNDIGGISCPSHDQTEKATIFIYDGYTGGVGLSRAAFAQMASLLQATEKAIADCGCENGCPSCVHSPKCGSGNRPIDKQACLILLRRILAGPSQTASISQVDIAIPAQPVLFNPPASMFSKGEGTQQVKQKTASLPKGLDCLPERYGVFDLETIHSADEVGGWHRAEKMRVSVAVIYDSLLDDFVTYLEPEMERMVNHLRELQLVVGFNNKRFDNRVLSAYTSIDLNGLPAIDLLEEVQGYLGYRLSLNSLAAETLGAAKSADGLQALQWYKEGRIDLIQKYCRKDVEITRDLFLYAMEQGYLIFRNKARQQVKLPLALEKAIAAQLRS